VLLTQVFPNSVWKHQMKLAEGGPLVGFHGCGSFHGASYRMHSVAFDFIGFAFESGRVAVWETLFRPPSIRVRIYRNT